MQRFGKKGCIYDLKKVAKFQGQKGDTYCRRSRHFEEFCVITYEGVKKVPTLSGKVRNIRLGE